MQRPTKALNEKKVEESSIQLIKGIMHAWLAVV